MTVYAMQRCIFDHLRSLERTDRKADDVATEGYDLSGVERRALETNDVATLYDLGLHPVLINAFCRANGWRRDEYKVLFRPDQMPTPRRARWQTS